MLFKFKHIAWLRRISLTVCFWLGWAQGQAGVPLDSREYQIKAAFLLNFSKFVTYPEGIFSNSSSSVNICILGDDPFQGSLDTLVKGEKFQERSAKVFYLQDIEQKNECHTLFVSKSEQGRVASVIAYVKRQAVLTVSDIEDFVTYGGMIQFYIVNNTVRFSIDPVTVSDAKLKMSSRLLQVAKVVRK